MDGADGIRLVPLASEHTAHLLPLIDDELWAGMSTPTPRTLDDVLALVSAAHATPGRYAFAVLGPDDVVRGSTSFYDVEPGAGRCEIGYTYYGRAWWGGRTNPACKLALLSHAFDVWGMHRVALRSDARNARSRAAMAKLGAVHEGVLRGHRTDPSGARADTAYYSILAPEWPVVRAGLQDRLSRP